MTVSIDSSLLVSLYVKDPNSTQAVQRMIARPDVWLTPLHRSELAHALYRYVFKNKFGDFEARQVWKRFEEDCAIGAWALVDFPVSAWATSVDLARRYSATLGMRTLDSLHVACALEMKAQRFWTFDDRQARLAQAVGLDPTV